MKKKMKGKIKLKRGERNIELRFFQSPRGLRFENKRPDKISLKFKGKDMSAVDFCNLIEYLITLQQSMV